MGSPRLRSMASVALVAGLLGCGATPPESAVPRPSVSGGASSASAFYGHFVPGPAAELPREPASLADAADLSTAVVRAAVGEVRVGRTVGDLHMVVVRLRPEKVLHGALQEHLGQVVDVELPGAFAPDDVTPLVDSLQRDTPMESAVWFLRWQGEPPAAIKPGGPTVDPVADFTLYSLVHWNAGVFVQGPNGVESAVAQRSSDMSGGSPSARREAESLGSLEELIAQVG